MIETLIAFFNQFQLPVNFLTHILVFMCSIYIAIHNRKIPQRYLTPLWYIGNISLFIAFTIGLQWTFGPEYALSYWKIGLMGETLLNIGIAFMAIIIFMGTVSQDIKSSKLRKHYD